jgi:hypothetical protein
MMRPKGTNPSFLYYLHEAVLQVALLGSIALALFTSSGMAGIMVAHHQMVDAVELRQHNRHPLLGQREVAEVIDDIVRLHHRVVASNHLAGHVINIGKGTIAVVGLYDVGVPDVPIAD